jgi:sugar lactone lactonase YvrE
MTRTTRVFLTGLQFGEGPRWHDGRLWFSDFYQHAVFAVSEDGKLERMVEVPMQPSGLGWLPDGRLLVVSMLDRCVLRREPDGTLIRHADLSRLAPFHCNDMVVDRVGRAYVGNFGFDLQAMRDTAREGKPRPQPVPTILIRVDPDGTPSIAADQLHFPNGAVITPDSGMLIIGETFANRLTAFDVAADGTLSNRRVWADLQSTGVLPDGVCLDAEGAIWVSNPAAPEVLRVAEGGRVLERLTTTQSSFACMLGGQDRKTLYVLTAPDSGRDRTLERKGAIEIAPVDVPGAGLP